MRAPAAALLLTLAACAGVSAAYGPYGAPVGRIVAGDLASLEFTAAGRRVGAGYAGPIDRIDDPITVRPATVSYRGSSLTYRLADLSLLNRTNFDGVDVRGGAGLETGLRGSVRAEADGFFLEEAHYVDAVLANGPAFLLRQWMHTSGERRQMLGLYPVVQSVPVGRRGTLLDAQDAAGVFQPKMVAAARTVKTGDRWWTDEELGRNVLAATSGLIGVRATRATGGGQVLGMTMVDGRRAVVVKEEYLVDLSFTGGTAAVGGRGWALYDVATGLPIDAAVFGVTTVKRQGDLLLSEVWAVTSVRRTIEE